jgi:transcriptional regulator with XRE-family HTH domain
MPTIGQTLRRLRKERRMGQVELGKRSGVAQQTISGIERDHREPHASTLRKLAEVLDVSLAEFFQEDGAPKVPPPPKTPIADSTPEDLESRVFGSPAREIGGELKPVLTKPEAMELSDAASKERDALEDWIRQYAAAPSDEKFGRRADHERVLELLKRAGFYHEWLFNVWSLLYDPRPVPFKSIEQFAAEQVEARTLFLSALENEAERQRIERSGEAG